MQEHVLTCLNKQTNNIKNTQKYEMQMWTPQAPHSFNFPPQEVTAVNILNMSPSRYILMS